MNSTLISSVSIEAAVAARNQLVAASRKTIEAMRDMEQMARGFGLDCPGYEWRTGKGYSTSPLVRIDKKVEIHDTAWEEMIRRIDGSCWRQLFERSQIETVMSLEAIRQMHDAWHKGDVPEFNEANILSTFTGLHDSAKNLFVDTVVDLFRKRSWDHKTNQPVAFGKKAIYHVSAYGLGVSWEGCQMLTEILRVLHVLDGQPLPDENTDGNALLHPATEKRDYAGRLIRRSICVGEKTENDYMACKYFANGNVHIEFKRLDLIRKMNEIVAERYPNALPR
jgi:hypothetical protein